MPSETDTINTGLRFIGATAVSSRTDGSTNANIVDDLYDEILDDLLRSHNWNFATKRASLAELSTAPTFEFDNAFAVPSDWLRTVSVHDNDAGISTIKYRMEEVEGSNAIVTNSENVWLRYIAQVTDYNLMTADFRMLVSLAVAASCALPIAASNAMHEAFSNKLDRMLAKAKATDSMESFPESRPRGSWADSRGGWYDSATVWPR